MKTTSSIKCLKEQAPEKHGLGIVSNQEVPCVYNINNDGTNSRHVLKYTYIMDPKSGATIDSEFNTILFEKKLTGLKDSQDSINTCCHWCLQNRQHHKKIVSCWLNVLKRVKVEQRLTLFYLANDVIQYSKRRNYDFVESWGTTLQKATTMVRDEKVKHKILRIFKIWEQRGVYGEEFVTDLCGLISAAPSTRKGDEAHEFQSAYLIQKIKTCSRLETDTDTKLRQLKEHNPKIHPESESLISSLKDRAHVDDVEKEVDDYIKQMESYINALKTEIKSRVNLISLLSQAEVQLENDKKDVKLVTTAYRTFASRVRTLKKKLDELMPALTSPVPSPDINAPSPSPDSDIELPGNDPVPAKDLVNNSAMIYGNPGYYNPVPPPSSSAESNKNSNRNISSFFGSSMQFNLANLNTSTLFGNEQNQNTITNAASQTQTANNNYNINDAISSLFPAMACPPPPPSLSSGGQQQNATNFQYNNGGHVPLMPPPMPPFNKSDDIYGGANYGDSYTENNANFGNSAYDPTTPYQPSTQTYQPPTTTYEGSDTNMYQVPAQRDANFQQPAQFNSDYPQYQPTETTVSSNYQTSVPALSNSYPSVEEYNPEEELETWDPEPTWEPPPAIDLETPESPPMFEKEGYVEPIEYHDRNVFQGNAADVDHRVIPGLTMKSTDETGHRTKDVDHRNLISLTGSPVDAEHSWNSHGDQDYRKPVKSSNLDQDYRVPLIMENFNLPPPPPPPKLNQQQSEELNFKQNHSKSLKRHGFSPKKTQDNNESIDMDLSDDEQDKNQKSEAGERFLNNSSGHLLPPPFPDLFDDADANSFLDSMNDEIEDYEPDDLDVIDPGLSPLPVKPGLLGVAPMSAFPSSLSSDDNEDFSNQGPPPNWAEQNFVNNRFRGRGGNFNYNNRGGPFIRGNWGNRDFKNVRNHMRGMPPRGGGGGPMFRGNRLGYRGNIHRGRSMNRGRGIRGNYRGGF